MSCNRILRVGDAPHIFLCGSIPCFAAVSVLRSLLQVDTPRRHLIICELSAIRCFNKIIIISIFTLIRGTLAGAASDRS